MTMRLCRTNILLSEGCWLDSPGLHVKVSLDKILNPKTATDVLVGTLHGIHHYHFMNVCMNYCQSLWTKLVVNPNCGTCENRKLEGRSRSRYEGEGLQTHPCICTCTYAQWSTECHFSLTSITHPLCAGKHVRMSHSKSISTHRVSFFHQDLRIFLPVCPLVLTVLSHCRNAKYPRPPPTPG